ncbi:hypothetical protein D920_01460 [Enterococcus faecalis 13-SD-W-01]|nr:hypothetical protein D920_01460 [Enterococcus faecalis 13-SD-W-01]
MSNEEYKRPKEKILEVMDSVPDKNNNYYKQVMETLKKREEWKWLDGEELAARRKQKILTMDEVVEACHSFQHITDNADVGKVLFNYLSEPITNKKFWLKTIIQTKNGKHSEDVIEWAKEEHEKLTVEIQSGCLDLQDKLTSMETKNYIFSMTSDLFHSGTHRSFNYRELTNGEAAEKGYRKIAIDSFFGTKEEEQGIFELFYDYLKHNERLHEILKSKNFSYLEKKAYIHIAVTRSNLGISADAIPYIHGKFERKSSVINKQIADKKIAAFIDKEVSIDTVIMCDDLLGKTKIDTADLMIRLYGEVKSTAIKEYIREKAAASLIREDQLHFYKETILQKLTKENQQELGQAFVHLLKQTSDSSAITSKKLHQFEKVYAVVHSEESKARYDYLEAKELLNGLGKITFGQEAWEKFDKIVLLRQEVSDKKVKETIQLPEMMEKSVEEIRKQRIENALRTIEVDKSVHRGPDEIADTMLKLKAHFIDWEDKLKEQVQTYLTNHLSKDDQEQVGQIFKDKEVLQEVLSILPNWEVKWQKMLDSLARAPAVNKVDEIKEALDKRKIDYLFPIAAEFIQVELDNKQIPHSTPHERKKVLDLLKNTEREKELVGSITKKLQSNEFQPSEDQVNRWINRYLKMDAEEIEAEKRKIVLAIEKLISKKTKGKDTALTDFRKDLVRAEQNIEGIMRTAFLAEINHNFYRTDKEEKFADCIYRSEEIRHWMKQNPALKEVFYEGQKRVPFNEFSTWNNSKENEQVKPNIRDWWLERWGRVRDILEFYADKKQFLTSALNQRIEMLKEVDDSNQSAEVVWSLVVDKAGVPIDLDSQYKHLFNPGDTDYWRDVKRAQALVDSYISLKEHNQEQKEARIQPTATIPPQKETITRESKQSLAEKVKVTGTIPKTNAAVTSQPAAFETVKRQVTKEIPETSGSNLKRENQGLVKIEALKDLKKEISENNQQKKRNESIVQEKKKAFEK